MRIIKIYGPAGSFHAIQCKHPVNKRVYVRSEVYSLQGEKLYIPLEWVITGGMHFVFFNDFYFYFKEWKDRIKDPNYDRQVNWYKVYHRNR